MPVGPNESRRWEQLLGKQSRRDILKLAGTLGISLPLAAVLAACGGTEPIEDLAPATATTASGTTPEPSADGGGGEDENGDGGGIISVGLWQEPDSLTWATGGASFSERAVLVTLHEPLLRVGPNNTLEPGLLEEVPTVENGGVSADGKTITIKLKPDLRWSDGEPLTIADYVFTHQTVIDPDTAATQLFGWDKIESISTPDDLTAVITLAEPYAPFVNVTMASWFGGLYPKHILEDGRDIRTEFGRAPIGTGPFKIVEWQAGSHIRVERNEHYHRGPAKLDGIVFRIMPDRNTVVAQVKNGDLDLAYDLTEAQIPELESIENLVLYTTPGTTVERYYFNARNPENLMEPHPALSDVRVRKAIVMAIDRQEIVDTLLYGRTTVAVNELGTTPYFNDSLAPLPFDPQQAAELLDEAGWLVGSDGVREKDGRRLSLTHITTAGNALREQMQVIVQQYLADVGIEMTIQNHRPAELWGGCGANGIAAQGEWDLAGWADTIAGIDPDISLFWSSSQAVDCQTNPSGYSNHRYANPDVDRLLREQEQAIDPEERAKIIREVQQVLHDDVNAVWFYYRLDIIAASKRLQGIQPTSFGGSFWNTGDWYIAS